LDTIVAFSFSKLLFSDRDSVEFGVVVALLSCFLVVSLSCVSSVGSCLSHGIFFLSLSSGRVVGDLDSL